jgi:hypothetical protein
MAVFQGSRYEFSVIDFVAIDPDADANAVVFYDFEDLGTFSYTEHEYVQGERIDSLAERYYRRPDLWWLILEHNPQIEDPTNIPSGTILRIPSV